MRWNELKWVEMNWNEMKGVERIWNEFVAIVFIFHEFFIFHDFKNVLWNDEKLRKRWKMKEIKSKYYDHAAFRNRGQKSAQFGNLTSSNLLHLFSCKNSVKSTSLFSRSEFRKWKFSWNRRIFLTFTLWKLRNLRNFTAMAYATVFCKISVKLTFYQGTLL